MSKNLYIADKQKLLKFINDLWNSKAESWQGNLTGALSILILIYTLIINTKLKAGIEDSFFEHFMALDKTLLFVFFILITILVTLIVFLSKSIIKNQKNKKINTNFEQTLSTISISTDYTSLFIIRTKLNNRTNILTTYNIKEGYWLPYIQKQEKVDEEYLKHELSKIFDFRFVIKKIPGTQLEALKDIPEKGYRKIFYNFYAVEFQVNYNDFINKLYNSENSYKFVTFEEMKKDILTIKTNYDVIELLSKRNLETIPDAFKKVTLNKDLDNLKVIWNITNKCEYSCAFCATNSGKTRISTDELTFENRVKIAEELKKIKGLRLDIAGGDPLYDESVVAFIQHMSKYMIQDATITTTGLAIKKYINGDMQSINNITNEFDISYDYPSVWNEKHRGSNYNKHNYEFIQKLIDNGIKVNILITLSKYNTKEKIIDKMIEEIKEINASSIILLRLIPVGRQEYSTYKEDIQEYTADNAIKLFKKAFKSKIKLHCAYRANINQDQHCNMLTEKIGINHLGDAFSCAWAGYLNIENKKNPFYLGNLVENSLEEIVNSEKFTDLYNVVTQNDGLNHCPIFSYLEKPDVPISENNDKYKDWIQAYKKNKEELV